MTRLLIILLYIGLAIFFISIAYQTFPLTTADDYKEFGVVVGIALAALVTFTNMLVSFYTLSEQKNAATRLEKLKAELAGELETVKQATSVKSQAYNQVCVAANKCYRELQQQLTNGTFDKTKAEAAQQLLIDAEGLIFNLDKETQDIVRTVTQSVFDIIDSADEIQKSTPPVQLEKALQRIWHDRVDKFGDGMNQLRARAPFLYTPPATVASSTT